MRVLHVIADMTAAWGGPPRAVAALTGALTRHGVECTVYAPTPKPDADGIAWPDTVEVRKFPTGRLAGIWPGHSPRMARELRACVREFDVVHIHELWHHPHYAAATSSRRARVPCVVSPHGTLAPRALGHRAWKKRIYAAAVQRRLLHECAALHAMTEVEQADARRFRVGARVTVIPWGVDPGDCSPPPAREAFEAGHPEVTGKRVVLFMGRLDAVKGLDVLVPAFARAAADRPDLFLVIAGPDHGYRVRTARLIRRAGLSARAAMVGPLSGDERLAALTRADVFVLPSYSEGFSVAVLEALAVGCPAVITHNCNFPEVAVTGAGLVVEPRVDQVADAVARILTEPGLAQRMSARARALIEERYTWDRITGRFVDLYESVSAGRNASARSA